MHILLMTKGLSMPEIIPNLHPVPVHFPIALISVVAFFHLAAIAARNKTCATPCAILAHATLWLGTLAAVPTVFLGWQTFNSVNHDAAGHAAMRVHRAWALGTLLLLLVLAAWDAWRSKVDAIPRGWFAGAVLGAWGMVAVTAWHGGELVYRHGVGVMAVPPVDHGHEHCHINEQDASPEPEHGHPDDEHQ
jgi:uncharacterized membrane protein